MIDLSNVKLTLPSDAGPVDILRGIDLSVTDGEQVAIVGPSGSGKSTLLMVLAGLELPSSGTVTLAGKELGALDEDGRAKFRRDHVGIIFQSFHLIPTMTALENIAVPLELAGDPDALEKAAAELEAVGLGHRGSHYPTQLSGGEQQRVAIARALVSDPAILLADEPTGNLDGKTGAAIVELMMQLHQTRKTTMILITHDEGLARSCERMVSIRDGLIADDQRNAA